MKKWLTAAGAMWLALTLTGRAGQARAPVVLWDLASSPFAATSGSLARVEGRVRMDGASAFAIPNSAFPDPSCFTIEMEIRFGALPEQSALCVLDQRVSDTGFALEALKWGRVGSPLTTTLNGIAYARNSFRAASNQVWRLVFAVRDGAVAVYQNNVAGPQYLLRITPNLAPVWIGRTTPRKGQTRVADYDILSLKVYGPETRYYLPGESAETMKNGFVGGQGWLVRLPVKTAKPLPNILYYGDSISMGYGDRFTELMKDKASCYHWCHFVGGVDHFPSAAFEAAASVAPFDIIIFNNGLHSLHWAPDKVTDAQIAHVARSMIRAFRKGAPHARLIWATTTPHTAKGRPVNGFGELNPIVCRINALTDAVAKEEGIERIDLYALLKDRLDLAAGDQYHWSAEAYRMIAEALRERCAALLRTGN
ncbi:MAG: SGNH/GDSL hydrolase family protein [Kiritimatiellae bacterium]|nr:SGNH/GDSL hydrolase family protein [Kiritimatiellia bacterium]